MSKRNRLKKQVEQTSIKDNPAPAVGLMLGTHQLRAFAGIDASFGAKMADYPTMAQVPVAFHDHSGPYQSVVTKLFFQGGSLPDYGLTIKKVIDRAQAMTAIRALLCSFEPKHEHKTAVVAWALSEWCDGTPTA